MAIPTVGMALALRALMENENFGFNNYYEKSFAWIAIIAIIAVIFVIHQASPVLVPIAIAGFIIATFTPLYNVVRKRTAHLAAASITALTAFLVTLAIFGAVGMGLHALYRELSAESESIRELVQSIRGWSEELGLSVAESAQGGIGGAYFAKELGSVVVDIVIGLGLAILFWLSMPAISDRFSDALRDERAQAWRRIAQKATKDVYRYIVARTLAGLGTGIVVAASCWALGLRLALFWGLLNFILNYIPTLGSILAVIPPAIFAYIQFGEPAMALTILATVGMVQLLFGLVVDPIIQGAYLRFPGFNILIFITFWGWLWGIPGAFLATPIMTVLVYILHRYQSTRPFAISLTDRRFEFD